MNSSMSLEAGLLTGAEQFTAALPGRESWIHLHRWKCLVDELDFKLWETFETAAHSAGIEKRQRTKKN